MVLQLGRAGPVSLKTVCTDASTLTLIWLFSAQVFIALHGTHGKLSKRRLWTPSMVDDADDDGGKVIDANEKFMFPRGEMRVFLLQGPDIGELCSLTIEVS